MIKPWLALGLVLFTSPVLAAGDDPKPMHWGAERSVVHRATNNIELRGNAFVNRDQETIRAAEIDLDQVGDKLQARGQVVYQYGITVVHADQIDLDLKTGTGVIKNGSISDGKVALRGSEIIKVGEGHYLVKNYDYSTCHDCPNSWIIHGKEVDLTVEGYAFIKDFVFKVKDAPVLWFPYLVLPMKTKRQTGFLFPRFGINEVYGSFVVEPFFWAINDWSDMTFGLGTYSKRGTRAEWEGRYKLTPRSEGVASFFWTNDESVGSLDSRFGAQFRATQELPFGFEGKLRFFEFSDSGYPIEFADDIPGRYEPNISSELFFTRNDPNMSTTISLRRIRNLLYFDEAKKFTPGFDTRTVQEFPRIVVNTNNQFLFGSKWVAGVEARFNRFARADGPIDIGTTADGTFVTIREANRLALLPNIYTVLKPTSWLSVTPSAQYRSYFYNFNSMYPDLARGYLLAQAEMSFQLERVFSAGQEGGSAYKHTFRPTLTYSVIPTIQESSDHPFVNQIQTTIRPGQYFDNADLVPIRATQNLDTYVTPLGHSLTYGVVSQLFKKRRISKDGSKVDRVAEVSALQTWDINEFKRKGIDLSPLFTQFLYEDGGLSWNTEYTYFYYLDRYTEAQLVQDASPHRLSSSLSWIWASYTKNNLLWFQRSFTVNYSFSKLTSRVSSLRGLLRFSLNDYLMPQVSAAFDLASENKALLESRYGMLFQNPSQCWRLEAAVTQSIDRGYGFIFNFSMNLLGTSFESMEDSLRSN